MSDNKNMQRAKDTKNDEFYTRYEDIEKEVSHYKDQLEGKIIYCNCDIWNKSQFVKFFVDHFEEYKLKTLMATGIYSNEIYSYFGNGESGLCYMTEDGEYPVGDYRSKDCIKLLKACDIVISNEPFSLFKDYIATLMKYHKQFLIIGNENAVTYKEVFPLIKDGKLRLGYNHVSKFLQPDGTLKHFGNVVWYTNLEVNKTNELVFTKHFNKEDYPCYDNYPAFDVGRVADIPIEKDVVMEVSQKEYEKMKRLGFDIEVLEE